MSLILEALKKLEREKQTPERGFLVVGMAPWSSREGRGMRTLLVLLLVVVMAGVYAWVAHAPVQPQREAASATEAPAAAAAPVTVPPPAAVTPPPVAASPSFPDKPVSAQAASPRPAAPAAAQTAAGANNLVLTAISQKDGKPIAVLNDRFVREGDSFDGVHVMRIGETEVEVEVNGHRMVVTF